MVNRSLDVQRLHDAPFQRYSIANRDLLVINDGEDTVRLQAERGAFSLSGFTLRGRSSLGLIFNGRLSRLWLG